MSEHSTPIPTQLYIRLAAETLHFARFSASPAFFESASRKVRRDAALAADLQEAAATMPLLQARIGRTRVLVEAPVCLVPLAEFQEEDCESIYHYCFASETPRKVFYDTVPGCGHALLFALDKPTERAISETFPEATYTSAATPLLRHFVRKSEGQRRIFASAEGEKMFLAALDDTKLLSACYYDIHSPLDAVYYIAYTARTFGLDLKKGVPVFVSGDAATRDSICTALAPYARNAVAVKPSAEFNRHPAALDEQMPYDFITLLTD